MRLGLWPEVGGGNIAFRSINPSGKFICMMSIMWVSLTECDLSISLLMVLANGFNALNFVL